MAELHEAMDAILSPNGDVHAAHEHTYYLGSVLRSGETTDNPLVVEIDVTNLGEPVVPILEHQGWRVRVVAGQGEEPIHGRVNGIELRVVRANE